MVFVLVFFTAFVESIESIFCEFCEWLYCTNRVILLFALQVQRRQARKPFVSPSNEPPTQELPSTVTPLRSTREEPPSLPSLSKAFRNWLSVVEKIKRLPCLAGWKRPVQTLKT